MFKKIIWTFLCLTSSWLQASGQLTIGTNAEFPPFCYIENHEIVGFDIDVAKEVAKRLGKTAHFKDMPFDALISDLMLGRVDFVAAGMSYTDERAKRVSFTKSYISNDPLVIFSTSKSYKDVKDLKGKNVVVVEGFNADTWMSSQEGIRLTRLPTQADGFMSIISGRADAFVTAKSTVDAFFKVQDPSKFYLSIIDGTGETCALVVPKNQAERLKEIQNALDAMELDGTFEQLKTRWKLQ